MKQTIDAETKEGKIKSLVLDMLKESYEAMIKKVDKAIHSGAVDIDEWDESYQPMILPKCIVTAILQNEAAQYEGKGTSFENKVKKEVKNIRHFI
jgi:predicted transcriptional regulator